MNAYRLALADFVPLTFVYRRAISPSSDRGALPNTPQSASPTGHPTGLRGPREGDTRLGCRTDANQSSCDRTGSDVVRHLRAVVAVPVPPHGKYQLGPLLPDESERQEKLYAARALATRGAIRPGNRGLAVCSFSIGSAHELCPAPRGAWGIFIVVLDEDFHDVVATSIDKAGVPAHPVAHDLDIRGPGSLMQLRIDQPEACGARCCVGEDAA